MLELILLSDLIFGFIIGGVANSRGLSFWKWGLYGFFLWPIALVHLLVILFDGGGSVQVMRRVGRVCPYCAESIRDEAIVCKHCHRDLTTPPPKRAPVTMAELRQPPVTVERPRRKEIQ